jgi:hypothetical protein
MTTGLSIDLQEAAIPLKSGSSRSTVAGNIREMVRAGHPQRQAVAAAMRKKRQSKRGRRSGRK